MHPIDEFKADLLAMMADDHNDIKKALTEINKEEARNEVRSKLAKVYGIPVEGLAYKDKGYWTARTVRELGPIDTAYPLADGTMMEKADIIEGRLVRSGIFKKNGKKIFSMDPEMLVLDVLGVKHE